MQLTRGDEKFATTIGKSKSNLKTALLHALPIPLFTAETAPGFGSIGKSE